MPTRSASPGYVLCRSTDSDAYTIWKFNPQSTKILTPVAGVGGTFPHDNSVVYIGNYFLWWGQQQSVGGKPSDGGTPFFQYGLVPYESASKDPLNAPPLQAGMWPKQKFWGLEADFGNPQGGHTQYDTDKVLELIPLGTFLLNFIPNTGRGTFGVWSFDPAPTMPGGADPIPSPWPYTASSSFRNIQSGHQLLPFNGYVLDRETDTGAYRLWSFDPQAIIPLVYPPLQSGTWRNIGADHQLVPIGDYVLDWHPKTGKFRVWSFDPKSSKVLTGPVSSGTLPDGFTATSTLMGFQPPIPIDEAKAHRTGSIDFMRKKIEHVVYYMLENRSFDHVVGWLHDKDAKIHVVGPKGPYKGASETMYNVNGAGERVYLSKYKDGKLSTKWLLEMFQYDPYHDLSDVLRQMYHKNPNGYDEHGKPDMGGFVINNSSAQVMQTYTPTQLPVLNGLAKSFAISDDWFCSMPSATDVNRSFAVTGSAQLQANNFMEIPQYNYWPEQPHRASIWKTLWANGITDWTIYNSTLWQGQIFTYELFLMGQIPTVDAAVQKNSLQYLAPVQQFYQQATSGTLPAFSYIEPIWIGNAGTTSYHPGEDLVPGEVQLNLIYDSLRKSPKWENTLLIVTFDEHGGIFDHVPPPAGEKPWAHDQVDGFRYDTMGPRVPTIVASPWVDEDTVFRSTTDVAYDGTSFAATLFQWFGIPRERWFHGERMNHAPSFEGVLTRGAPRSDSPAFKPPYDKAYPPTGQPSPTTNIHNLHLHIAHVLVGAMTRGKLTAAEAATLSHSIATETRDVVALTRRLDELSQKYK